MTSQTTTEQTPRTISELVVAHGWDGLEKDARKKFSVKGDRSLAQAILSEVNVRAGVFSKSEFKAEMENVLVARDADLADAVARFLTATDERLG